MKPKRVSFDTVEIREYPIVLSTNPASQWGPAIELGWEYRLTSDVRGVAVKEGRLSVSEYESLCPSCRRRGTSELRLPLDERFQRVKAHNFSDDEIERAWKERAAIYKSRVRSISCLSPAYVVREVVASVRRHAMIRRAVHNLTKLPNKKPQNIYDGWWLPRSSHLL